MLYKNTVYKTVVSLTPEYSAYSNIIHLSHNKSQHQIQYQLPAHGETKLNQDRPVDISDRDMERQ